MKIKYASSKFTLVGSALFLTTALSMGLTRSEGLQPGEGVTVERPPLDGSEPSGPADDILYRVVVVRLLTEPV